ncbi:MAG: hypothetical protein ACRCTL_09100 [Pseudomonas sp.]
MDKLMKTALTSDGMGLVDKLVLFSPAKKVLIFHALEKSQRIIKRLRVFMAEG